MNQKASFSEVIPTKIFPPEVVDVLEDITTNGNLPYNLTAAAMLAVAATIAGPCTLQYNITWQIHSNIFLALVSGSGSRKTPVMKFALAPLNDMDETSLAQYNREIKEYRKNEKNFPQKPQPKQFVFRDATTEALAVGLNNNTSILVHFDELARLFLSMNQYRGKGADEQFWLSVYSGSPITVNRSSKDEICFVKHPVASVLGSVQQDVLPGILHKGRYADGFAQRFLFCTDPDAEKAVLLSSDTDISEDSVRLWHAFVEKLQDEVSQLKTPFTLSIKAKECFCEWCNKRELTTEAKGGDFSILRKMEEVVLKLTMLDHILNARVGYVIDIESVNVAIGLAEFFLKTASYIQNLSLGKNKTYNQFLHKLGSTFTTKEAEIAAAAIGVKAATCYNWLKECQEHRLIKKEGYGRYSKLILS